MSSHDDPEARIRDLERSLSEQSTELTHSVHDTDRQAADEYHRPSPPPYLPTQQHHGVPFPPPVTTSAGAGRGWILYAVLATVVAVGIGGAVTFFVNAFHTVGSVVDVFDGGPPAVEGGGGPFDVPSGQSGGIQPTATTLAPAVPAVPGDVVTVSGVGENRTIACEGGVVNISGVDNRVVITGRCARVSVSGVEIVVTVAEALRISASGFDNRVTYLAGTPDVDQSGNANVVERG